VPIPAIRLKFRLKSFSIESAGASCGRSATQENRFQNFKSSTFIWGKKIKDLLKIEKFNP
jgi:hypothetical protein